MQTQAHAFTFFSLNKVFKQKLLLLLLAQILNDYISMISFRMILVTLRQIERNLILVSKQSLLFFFNFGHLRWVLFRRFRFPYTATQDLINIGNRIARKLPFTHFPANNQLGADRLT